MVISVLLSTYNGAKYLREQINSILEQKNVDVDLCIRDDGSKDETLDIIKDYANNYENVHIVTGGLDGSVGVGRSFMSMLYDLNDEYDYYAFADQDDIWDPDKLNCAVSSLKKCDNEPSLYVCNQRCVDFKGNFMNKRFPDDFPKQALNNILFTNLYAGCTMVFNGRLKELLCDTDRRPSIDYFQHRIHDAWTACVASSSGRLIYDPECHMSFRRHNSNATDAEIRRGKHLGLKKLYLTYKSKFRRLKSRGYLNRNGIQLTAENLLIGYGDLIDKKSKILLSIVGSYKDSFPNKMKLLFGNTVKDAVPESRWNIRFKILFNLL